jgi:hypothetical protein
MSRVKMIVRPNGARNISSVKNPPMLTKSTRRVAYYALHYGKEYLAWSIRSIQDSVEAIYIFYSATPSYGYSQGAPCPDTREELVAEANRFATKPIIWVDGAWANEGQHRDAALQRLQADGYGLVLVVDADEMWSPGAATRALDVATGADSTRRWMMRFTNFWKSFRWVIRDHFTPIRVVDLRHGLSPHDAMLDGIPGVLHFGYAQREELMRYKWTCHGHQAELRAGWMEKFFGWKEGDVDLHPCVNNLWAEAYPTAEEDLTRVEEVLRDHPYFGVDVIR